MVKLLNEYKSSLKHIELEESIDLLIFRPLSFLLVKILYRFPITPNQISLFSVISGLASAYFFMRGDRESFFLAALFYIMAHIFDCSDGMIARLKKQGTLIGRIVDGWSDYIVTVGILVGLYIGLDRASYHFGLPLPLLMALTALSLGVHCMLVDYYRQEFLAKGLGKKESIWDKKELFSQELQRLKSKKGKNIQKLMIAFYLGYTNIQLQNSNKTEMYDRKAYFTHNRRLLFFWNLIGNTTHMFFIVLGALFYQPIIFFAYILGIANLMMVILIIFQTKANKRLMLKSSI